MELRSGAVVPPPTPVEQDSHFREGVRLIFSRWTALQLAIQNEWGGTGSAGTAQKLEQDVVRWLYTRRGPAYADELEGVLDEAMLEGFNADIDDGSLREVAEHVLRIYADCAAGNFDSVRQLAEAASTAPKSVARSQQAVTEDESDDEDDVMVGVTGEVPESSRGQDAMEVEGTVANKSNSSNTMAPVVPQLTPEEVADGWEPAPTKGRRRNR